tara:strand:+ start:248 stop:460 length:213 start_codon:yes stop_codon:yes gene_type:complete
VLVDGFLAVAEPVKLVGPPDTLNVNLFLLQLLPLLLPPLLPLSLFFVLVLLNLLVKVYLFEVVVEVLELQ